MMHGDARALFPVLEQTAYLNAGTFGPLSRTTAAAMAVQDECALQTGRVGLGALDRALELRLTLRRAIAGLIAVSPEQISLTASTTDGCNIVLAGLELSSDDEIVTTTDEHFGLLGPLAVSPARVVVVPPEPDRIVAAVTPRTKLIALSHVLWTTGALLPVSELRERTGVPMLVDGAQSVGAVPVDARNVDFYTVSGQKWLCGPDATGALFVREPDRLRVGRPSYLAKSSHEPDGSFVPRVGAARFDPGWIPPGAVAGLAAAVGERPDWAFDHAADLAGRLRALLDPHVAVIRPDPCATLVSFAPPEGVTAADLVGRLELARVLVRDIPGRELVRASVGWWTDDRDLERLLAGVCG